MNGDIRVVVQLPISVADARVLLEAVEALQERIRQDEYPAPLREIIVEAYQPKDDYAYLRIRLIPNQPITQSTKETI